MSKSLSLNQIGSALSVLIPFLAMDLYIYPINSLGALGGPNTKQVLAGIGLVLFLIRAFKEKRGSISIQFLFATLLAFLFSIVGYISTEVNTTSDYTYAKYFISFFTWALSSLTVVESIRWTHGKANLRLVTDYLLASAVFQCIMALLIDNVPSIELFVDNYLLDQSFLFPKSLSRLYGIGAALDTAGIRMAVTFVLATAVISTDPQIYNFKCRYNWYIVSMLIVLVVGNMMARTTTTGVMIGIGLMIFNFYFPQRQQTKSELKPLLNALLKNTLLFSLLCILLYHTNKEFQSLFEYGFEGFFNLFHEGEWRTGSTDILQTLWVWPTDLQGWIIGYGNFSWEHGYTTDIGYCRFTLYSGLVGLALFSLFFIYQLIAFGETISKYRLLMWALMVLQFVIWIKVSSDIFFVIALFYWLDVSKTKDTVLKV